ncbi:Secreted frizzled- protein 5 [Homalodisca vitripennis]|nr:Secreted frizzled- protein 5 [Homalodisca vitripennis]KAG8264650.1 Secreted frizzled- protein 5 [Homalodisca vitripennis]
MVVCHSRCQLIVSRRCSYTCRLTVTNIQCFADPLRQPPFTIQIEMHSMSRNGCKMCNHVETYENILDNFCTSDFVIRTRFKRVHKSKLNCKKVKILKKLKPGILSRKLRRPVLILDPPNLCCEEKIKKKNQENYLVMGHIRGNNLVPSFIMQWIAKSSKIFKQAIRMFKNLNCTDPKFISRSVIGDMLHLGDLSAVSNPVFTQKDVQFPFSMSVPSN